MKVLAKDLDANTPYLLCLIKDWESHRQGSRHWFWVPGEGIIKTVKGARLYLAALYAHRNSGTFKIFRDGFQLVCLCLVSLTLHKEIINIPC